MNDLDENVVLDFSGHFSERGVVRAHSKKENIKSFAVTDQFAKKTHNVKSKQENDSSSKRNANVHKRIAEAVTVIDHSGAAKKQRTDSEGDPVGRTKAKRVGDGLWPFQVDYNDHFETPLQAVRDIEPVLQLLSKKLKKPKSNLEIYDPFFCQGGIRRHYEQLGFKNFIHRNRDFYKDVASGNIPTYDILVTNPPYSADHKERILELCLRSRKPWALLLPNYVATKAYFGELLDTTSAATSQRPFFLTPLARYSYEHPEGTGHEESPFFSIWYVGLGEHTEAVYGACKAQLDAQGEGSAGGSSKDAAANRGAGQWDVSIARTVDALRQAKAVPTARRLNPKQRARLKQQKLKG